MLGDSCPFVKKEKKKKKLLSMRNTDGGNILFISPCILQIMAPFVKRLSCWGSKGGCGAAGGTKSSKKKKPQKTEIRNGFAVAFPFQFG